MTKILKISVDIIKYHHLYVINYDKLVYTTSHNQSQTNVDILYIL